MEEDKFGWLTPLFAAFILYDRRAAIATAWTQCSSEGAGYSGGIAGTVIAAIIWTTFTSGLVLFLAAAADRASSGPAIKSSFLISAGIGAVLITLPWLTAPRPILVRRCGWKQDQRLKLCTLLAFPCLVWIFSEPWTSLAEIQLSTHILGPMAATVTTIFDWLGAPVVRSGNIITMPDHGRIGVEEACSGIRSFAACLFASTFLGALYLKRFTRQFGLAVISTVFAVCFNFGRSLFLTAWAYKFGTKAIDGLVHDAAGYFVMGLTIAGLFLVLRLIAVPFRDTTQEKE